MTMEIERKFLMPDVPPSSRLGVGVRLRQGYLAEEDSVEVRVRITTDTATLTVKSGSGISRVEVEVGIPLEQAEALWPHTVGRRVEKTRYRVALDEPPTHVAEVDVYTGPLAGLCVAEVEFGSDEDAKAFVPPAWFGREVTTEPGWNNAALARSGRPD